MQTKLVSTGVGEKAALREKNLMICIDADINGI